MKIFLIENYFFDLGKGEQASLYDYTIFYDEKHNISEVVPSKGSYINGIIYDLDNEMLEFMDTYHGIGIGLYERRQVKAIRLLDNAKLDVFIYLYIGAALELK